MRSLLTAVSLLFLGLLTFQWLRARPTPGHPPAPEQAPVPAAKPVAALELPVPAAPVRAPEPASAAPLPKAGPRAHVFGRIVDESGAPAQSVTVYLTSSEPWGSDEPAPT